jgi:hypothetical protein
MAVVTLCLVARVAWRRPDPAAEGALLALSALLCTPFLLDYDLVCLAIPLAWIAAQVPRTGWFGWEKIVLLAAYLLPLVARLLGWITGIGITPIVMAALLWITLRRVAAEAGSRDPGTGTRVPHAQPGGIIKLLCGVCCRREPRQRRKSLLLLFFRKEGLSASLPDLEHQADAHLRPLKP